MTRPRPSAFFDLRYRNPTYPGLELETFTLSELRQRLSARYYERGQRVHFHLLILYIDGEGTHEVDFVPHRCRPGTLIHVRPGQVQRYVDIQALEAMVIFFTPGFLLGEGLGGLSALESGRLDDGTLPSVIQLDAPRFEALRSGFEAIRREYLRAQGPSVPILWHFLQALLLQWAREAQHLAPTGGDRRRHEEVFRRFRQLVEREFARTRKAEDYARMLGCSPRTLNRASHAMAGCSAKAYIDARVLLEARRLLAYTTLPVSRIATTLGFSEPTNFIKYFRRETGGLPGAFRDAYHHAGA